MAICSATTACASKNASLTSGLRPVEKLSPTIGTTNRPFTRILPLSQRVAHAHCLSQVRLRGFQDGEHSSGATKVKQALAAGGDILLVACARAEMVAELIIASTEPLG